MNHKLELNYRINEQLKLVSTIRLVGEIQPGIYNYNDAIQIANNLGLDLIEIANNDNVSICKILDFQKFIYQKQQKEKEIKKHSVKIEIKELRFTINIGEHDYQFKLNHAKNFLQAGNKVRMFIIFNGREINYVDKGKQLLERLINDLQDISTVEQAIKLDGRKLTTVLIHKR